MAKLVYNIEPASPSMISSLNRHCLQRVPDGASNIVPARTHLNRVLEGDERGVMQSLRNFYDRGVQKPTAQAEKPYLRIVLSASPEYFRPYDPEAIGTWDEDRLAAWIEASMKQLRAEHGDDLVFAELHLDEDTPHIHAVVAPTYGKKARKPGKQKRNETPEQFEARKVAAMASREMRTVGRASHPTLSKPGSFQKLRERMTLALDHLGIEYGEDRGVNAPDSMSTREWVIQQAADLREKEARLAREREQFDQDRAALTEERAAFDIEKDQLAEERKNLATEKQDHAAKVAQENKQIDIEWELLVDEQSIHKEEKADLLQERQAFAVEKQAETTSQARLAEWIERGVNNLSVAINRAQAGTHDTEIAAGDMADKPQQFAALKAAAPDKRPTLGFRARFWSLNYSDGSGPAPLPERIRTSLTAAFDRVASWATEIREARLEAKAAHTAATEAAAQTLTTAKDEAALIMQAARQRGDERASLDAQTKSLLSFIELMKTKITQIFGDDNYRQVAEVVNKEWLTHPDNLDRPLTEAPAARSSPPGHDGP